jgi:NAD(P)-dependent dehydrogenase (short-subunit alcohol dehydrogenase family)
MAVAATSARRGKCIDVSGLLDDRGVVITGAGRGLGRSFALAAARAGAGVVVNDIEIDEARRVVAEIEADGGRAIADGSSVADWDQAGALIDACVSEFGAIDGLVNNAIAYSYFGPPWDENGDQIRREVEVAVLGTLYCGVHAMRHMKARRTGSIVNLTSRSMMGVVGMSTYVTVKGATASATFAWALELMEHGVRVNALAPSAHTRAHELAAGAGTYRPSQAAVAKSPDVVAPVVVYLLSDLSAGVTGQIVAMLGGKLGLLRHPRMHEHIEERESWTPEKIAEVVEHVYGDDLQPIGFEATEYQLAQG